MLQRYIWPDNWWAGLTDEEQQKLERVDFETYNETEIYNKWDSVLHNWKYYIINIDGFTGSFDTDNASEVGNVYEVFLEKIWELANLETTDKTKIVNAINEIKGLIDDVDITSIIDDTKNTWANITYSIDKIKQLIEQGKNELLNGVDSAYDTLKEIADELTTIKEDVATLTQDVEKNTNDIATLNGSLWNKIESWSLATINGQSLEQWGNIEIEWWESSWTDEETTMLLDEQIPNKMYKIDNFNF